MALPLTRSAMERLGKRLAKQSPPDDADIESLQELLLSFDEPLGEAVRLVHDTLGLEATSRIKTTGTILDKLRRHGGAILKSMQDLAGMRVVGAFNRTEQDVIVTKLIELFAVEGQPAPKVMDRRETPSSGYRAVHVVVHVDGVPVEIQVRTRLQHEWADMYEKLADRVGRSIRYGEPLAFPPAPVVTDEAGNPLGDEPPATELHQAKAAFVEAVVNNAQSLSDYVSTCEEAAAAGMPTALLAQHLESVTDGIGELRVAIDAFDAFD